MEFGTMAQGNLDTPDYPKLGQWTVRCRVAYRYTMMRKNGKIPNVVNETKLSDLQIKLLQDLVCRHIASQLP